MLRVMMPFMGHHVLNKITLQTLNDFNTWLRKLRRKEDGDGNLTFELSDSRVNRYLALISRVLHHVHALGWIPGVPKIPYEDKRKGRIRWLNAEEAKRLLQELPLHLRQFARFSLATGLRQSNVTYLRWDQVSIEHRRAWIHADESKKGNPNCRSPERRCHRDIERAERPSSRVRVRLHKQSGQVGSSRKSLHEGLEKSL
jgi:integrase